MTRLVHPVDKVMSRDDVLRRFGRPRCGRIVFTNGVFDILHRGHVEYLFAARALGDALVVGLNTDDSVRRLAKAPGRPINPQDDRAMVLAALGCVDAVTLFDEDTPHAIITALMPDLLVKGGDYTVNTIVGAPEVLAAGGRVEVIPLTPGRSTTSILERARGGGERG
jgi:D-beta-D-heptose 7-phosphate kinase/D-beta-D-heptose 1-phosphate adenosyltransferase